MLLGSIASLPAAAAVAALNAATPGVTALPPARVLIAPSSVAAAPATAAEITVLTYNVRGLPWPLATNRAKALAVIGKELAQLRREGRQPDVVLIQEGFRGEVATLVKASGYAYWVRGPSRQDRGAQPSRRRSWPHLARGEGWGKFTGAGLHILSDLPITESRRLAYSACAGWDCLANKGVLLARVRLKDAPIEVDILNTHMNSRRAAGVSPARSSLAHNRQMEELFGFLRTARADLPLLVGGDFNVKNAPERYEHQAAKRPFTVVSEFCSRTPAGCGQGEAQVREPWLQSQDLQAFAPRGAVAITPQRTSAMFAGQKLSDHDGYVVRYRLTWDAGLADAGTAREVTLAGR